MKYLVMECHQAYAVLMDEDSRFVNAANLNYTVGQTVTDPVLLGDMTPDRKSIITRSVMVKITAAAACLALVCMGGYGYYSRNIATSSVVVISSGADIEMHLNSRGEVVALESSSPSGQEIINRYNQTHKSGGNQTDVASALLEFQLEEGLISSGDTVSVYAQSGNESEVDDLINDLETSLPKLKIDRNNDRHGGGLQPVTPPTSDIRSNEPAATTAVHQKPTANAQETTVTAVIQKPDHQTKTEVAAPDPQLCQTTPVTEPAAPAHTRPESPERPTENPPPPPPQSHGTRLVHGNEATPETGTVAVPEVPAEIHTEPVQPEVPEIETPTELPPVTSPASPEVQQQTPDKKVHPTPKPEERLPEIAEPPLPENPDGQEFPELQETENSAKPLPETETLS